MNELTVGEPMELEVSDVIRQVQKISELMQSVLKVDQHYGTIPGTPKPTLYKAGAEKINVLFRLGTGEPQMIVTELSGGHRDYRATIPMIHLPTGRVVAYGTGSCSTMESKYRYRKASRVCPVCGSDAISKGKEEFGGGWFCSAKKGGCGAKFRDGDSSIEDQVVGNIENPDIADTYNTCLKMALKRAYVEGTIKATAASDFFTQDVEDLASAEGPTRLEKVPIRDSKPKPMDGLIQIRPEVEAARRKVIDHLHALVNAKIYTSLDAKEVEAKANRMSILIPASAIAELAKLFASLPKVAQSDTAGLDAAAEEAWPEAALRDATRAAMDPSDEPPPEQGEPY